MKKGFTLIELLAVIVILAIIALIALPLITGVVEKARKGSIESSALGWIDAVGKNVMAILVQEPDAVQDLSSLSGRYSVSNLSGLDNVKGQKPNDGWVEFDKGQIIDYELQFGDYTVTPKDDNPSKAVAVKNIYHFVYSRVNGGTHINYPITSNVDMGNKYVWQSADSELPFDSLNECLATGTTSDKCILKNFKTQNLDYKDKPLSNWTFYLKHTVNQDNIIKKIDVCGKYNNKEFCLDMKNNNSNFTENKNRLLSSFGNDNCTINVQLVKCTGENVFALINRRGIAVVGEENVSEDGSDCTGFKSGAYVCGNIND